MTKLYSKLEEEVFIKKIWRAVAVISIYTNFLLVPAACFGPPMSPEDVAQSMPQEDRARVIIELQSLQREEIGR